MRWCPDGTKSILFYVSDETLCSKQLKIDGKFEDVYCNPRPLEAPQKFLLALAAIRPWRFRIGGSEQLCGIFPLVTRCTYEALPLLVNTGYVETELGFRRSIF